MTPVRMSHSWSRRLYVGLFLLSAVYVALFILQTASIVSIPVALQVGPVPGMLAIGSFIGSAVLFFIVKKVNSFIPTLVVYGLFALATAILVQQTGGVSSYFLALWTLVAFFAALFGAYGWLPVIVLIGIYTGAIYLHQELSLQAGILLIFSSLVPVIAGMLIWRDPSNADEVASKNVKNLASQLTEVATKSEIVINAIGDGVIAVDGKGVIQLINPAAQTILGWGKQDALMLSYKSILKMYDENNNELDPSKDPIEQVMNTNQQMRGNKLIAVTQSGKKISISLVVSPIGDPGAGAIAVFRDVTNERAEEREQAEFISTASHEMRTPVASIEGYLGLALNPNTATVDQRGRDFIMKAHEAAQHLGRLFQDLLDVSKSEDGRMTNVPKVINLVPFTETIVQGLTQKATDKGLTLTFVPTEANSAVQRKIMPVYFVNQDNDHIREILDNLIENAIKYTPKGGVKVDITGTEDRVVVSVQDSGLGIPAEDLPHLFQKFYRVNNMDRQEIGGTGLGLYLARRLAEAMQGRLWVESTFQQGSTFFLELPRVSSHEAEHLQSEQAQQAARAATAQPVAVTPAQPVIPLQQVAPAPNVPQAAPTAPLASTAATPIPAATAPSAPAVKPATTVPRGETLTREQIAERVRQLEAMAEQQRAANSTPPGRQ